MVLCPVPWRGEYFVSYSFIRNIHQPTQAALKLLAPWYFVLYTISSNFCQLLLNEQNIHPWAIFLVWERMMIQIRVFCGQSSVRWLLLLPNITCPLYFTNWEREMVQLMISRSDQTVFIDPNFFCTVLSESALLWHLPIHVILMLVCYLQSCECKEFLLFVLLVLWIAVGILKNIRTIKLEQLFSKYLILWTLHCGNSRALAVSGRGSQWNLFNVQNLHQTFINLTQLAPPLVNKKFW